MTVTKDKIRNIAIIAHVDHGKTTLVDAFLKQSNAFRENQEEMTQDRIMDSNELERERGITIQAKNTSIMFKDHKINIIDTPGHADFGGEVERTLNMAECCILVVDAQEGVMPQTRFVLKRAFELGLKPVVVINKIDKKLANSENTSEKIQDLFLNLATDESQLDYKTFYAIARDGKVFADLPEEREEELDKLEGSTEVLLDHIIAEIPAPAGDVDEPLQMQVSSLDYDPHYGRYLIGRITRGTIKVNDKVVAVTTESIENPVKGVVKQINIKNALEYESVNEASVGEIVAIAGLEDVSIGDTICSTDKLEPLPTIEISPPSLKIKFEANTSPFLGREGKFPNLKQLQARLEHEAKMNVSLNIEKSQDGAYYVSGRGELHLAVLIETLRREGYEFQIRKPEVIITEIDGVKHEPLDEVYIEVPQEYFSVISREVNSRKGELIDMQQENEQTKVTYRVRTRNLIGMKRLLLTETKGNLVMNTQFAELVPVEEGIEVIKKGRLVSSDTGKALAYAMNMIQERGRLFIEPNVDVYEGMIIGVGKTENDMHVNPMKAREKSNVRMSKAQVTEISLKAPIQMTIEYAIGFLDDDEILEVTPENLRLRKKYLNKQQEYEANKRKKKN